MNPRPLRFRAAVLLAVLAASTPAYAGKLDLLLGGFSFQASNKRNATSSTLSGLGSYHLGYRHTIGEKFELAAGYSLLATKTLGGDLSFGVDLGVNYFFLTANTPIEIQAASTSATFQQRLRPYVGVSFHQRNFQSTSSQYAGAGLRLGVEYPLSGKVSAHGVFRYLSLGGPNQSTASETDALLGVMWQF